MRRAWRSSDKRWRRRCSTRWSSSGRSASSGACAMRWPVSRNPRANILQKDFAFPFRREIYFWHSAWRLLLSKNLCVGGLCGGGGSSEGQRRVKSERDRGKAKFGTASLVAELQRNEIGRAHV